jgi:uncharacterized protein (TIGR00730 family)
MKRICVFCGSSPGARQEYLNAAELMGSLLARKNISLVYGGGGVGIMAHMAKACLKSGGDVIGIIPRRLKESGVAFTDLPKLYGVESMHERKTMMIEASDGFIALPGGIGTVEEILEVISLAQLGMHKKPCGLLNVCNYFDRMIEFLGHAKDQKFIDASHYSMIQVDNTPEGLLKKFEEYQAPPMDKVSWVLKMNDGKT